MLSVVVALMKQHQQQQQQSGGGGGGGNELQRLLSHFCFEFAVECTAAAPQLSNVRSDAEKLVSMQDPLCLCNDSVAILLTN